MTKTPALPYRLDILPPTSPEEIENINIQNGYSGVRRHEATPAAIDRASEAKSAAPDRLRSWIFHPDESVALALIESDQLPGNADYPNKDTFLYLASLFDRARTAALQEQMLWTPLFDALASHRKWYMSEALWTHVRFSWSNRAPFVPGLVPCLTSKALGQTLSIPPLDEFLAPLVAWIKSQTDPTVVLPLLGFKSRAVRRLVATHTRNLTDRQVRQLLKDSDAKMATMLAGNPNITTPQRERVAKHVFACLARIGYGHLRSSAAKRALGRSKNAVLTIDELDKYNVTFMPRHLRRIALPKVQSHAMATDYLDGHWGARSYALDTIVAIKEKLPPDILQEAILNYKGASYELNRLISHPAMTEPVLIATVKHHTSFTARKAIARVAGRIQSAVVRDELGKSQSPGIAGALVGYETKPRRHNSLLKKALKNQEGREEFVKSFANFQEYPCLHTLNAEILAPLYVLTPSNPSQTSSWHQPLPYEVPALQTAIHALAIMRQVARHYKGSEGPPPLAMNAQAIFDQYYPFLVKTYLDMSVLRSTNNYMHRQTPQPPEQYKIKALSEILETLPELGDTLSIEELKIMLKSTDKEVRMATLKALPHAKRDATSLVSFLDAPVKPAGPKR